MVCVRSIVRYLAWPLLFFGFGGLIVSLGANDAGVLSMVSILLAAIAFSFLVERVAPYQPDWNKSHGDMKRDLAHTVVNLILNRAAVYLLPLFAWMAVGGAYWPSSWPFVLQVVLAVLVLDVGISGAHHASHKFGILWRFHAVHHSVKRLYGFNGLMKHPVHQGIETMAGVLPLLLLGIPFEVALTLPFLVAIALLGQHSNADIRTGGFKYLFANAETHRFHHSNGDTGDVNFGLFTHFYDHVAGTFHYVREQAPASSRELGIRGDDSYPAGYVDQLTKPFKHS